MINTQRPHTLQNPHIHPPQHTQTHPYPHPIIFYKPHSYPYGQHKEASRSLLRSFAYSWFLTAPCCFRLRMLRDGGIVHRLRLNNWPYLGQDTVKATTVGVDLRAVAPLLVLLSSSVVVSIVVLTFERGKFAFCNKSSQNATRRERNIYRQRSVFKATTPSNPAYPVFDIRKNDSTAYGFQ